MRNLRLSIAYDGTGYAGWQRQANGLAVQEVVERAFAPLLSGRPPALAGASRTDAGVHAMGQVASLRADLEIDAGAVQRALNVRLPAAVRVLDVADVDAAFHARFDARGKCYRYRIATERILSPFDRWYVWHVPWPVDVEAMRSAAGGILGRHDFASFQARGAAIADTVRTIHAIDVERTDGEIVIHVDGDGFLRHMVRTIVGSLVDVGSGTRDPEWLRQVVDARDRRLAGQTAPAAGLTLMSVRY